MYGLVFIFLKTTKMTGRAIWVNWWSINHRAIITVFSQSKACGREEEFPERKGRLKSGFLLCNFIVSLICTPEWELEGDTLTEITAGWYLLFSFCIQVFERQYESCESRAQITTFYADFNYYSYSRYIHKCSSSRTRWPPTRVLLNVLESGCVLITDWFQVFPVTNVVLHSIH